MNILNLLVENTKETNPNPAHSSVIGETVNISSLHLFHKKAKEIVAKSKQQFYRK